MKTDSGIATLALSIILSACGSEDSKPTSPPRPARPKISSITASDGALVAFTYQADKVSNVKSVGRDSKITADVTVQWDGDNISSLAFADTSGSGSPTIFKFTYSGGLLRSFAASGGSSTATTAFTYDGDWLASDTTTVPGNDGGTVKYEYTYDGGRLTRVTITEKPNESSTTEVSTMEYTYDGSGVLKSIEAKAGSTSTLTLFLQDTSNRLQKVMHGSTTETLEYGANGKVSRIIETGLSTKTYTYAYADGEATGIVPVPRVNGGGSFDLEGVLVPAGKRWIDTSWLVGDF